MVQDDDTADTDADGDELPEREEVLAALADGITEAHYQVTQGRVRSPEHDRVNQGWIRTLAYASTAFKQLQDDAKLEELHERIAALEDAGDDTEIQTVADTVEAIRAAGAER